MKFREQLEMSAPNTTFIRITNNQDCVPSLARGQHCGRHFHFDTNGRLSFDPSMWKKTVQMAQSIQGSAANMSYAGIADHSSIVYRKLIERHWVMSESSNSAANDGTFNMCESILYLMDMLQEDVKAVRRYKIQFRALLANILEVRPIILIMEDFLASGVDGKTRNMLNNGLTTFFEQLNKTKKEVLARHSKKSMLQSQGSKSSLKSFNQMMTRLANDLQSTVDILHRALSSAKLEGNTAPAYMSQFSWADTPPLPKYDSSAYQRVKFRSIDFSSMGGKPKGDSSVHVSQMLEEAEDLLENGKTEAALRVLESLDSGNLVVGSLTAEDKALASFLKGNAGYAALAQQWASANSNQASNNASMLSNFERHTLSGLFDEADDDGDNFLTTEELQSLLSRMGGIENVLDELGWIDTPGANEAELRQYADVLRQKQAILDGILRDMRTKYRNAVDLDQFVALMSQFAP